MNRLKVARASSRRPAVGKLRLKMESNGIPFIISGNRAALKHALSEIILNALQANPKGAQVGVKLQTGNDNGERVVTIEVQDTGTGFSVAVTLDDESTSYEYVFWLRKLTWEPNANIPVVVDPSEFVCVACRIWMDIFRSI